MNSSRMATHPAEPANHNNFSRGNKKMKLNSKELSQITYGALDVLEDEDYISFERFTKQQKE